MGNETVETVYGSVEVGTVECDSCGETILRDDAYRFRMGPPSNKGMSSVEYNGYACEHCASVGPASFPERVFSSDGDQPLFTFFDHSLFALLYPLTGFSLIGLLLTDSHIRSDTFAKAYVSSFIGALFWGGLLTYLFIL